MDHFEADDDPMVMTTEETVEMDVIDDYDTEELEQVEEMERRGDLDVQDIGYAAYAPALQNLDAWETNVPEDEFVGEHYFAEMNDQYKIGLNSAFATKDEAYYCIRRYHILKRAEFKVYKSQDDMMILVCKHAEESGCNWRVRVAIIKKRSYWTVTRYNGEHTCNTYNMLQKNCNMNVEFVAIELTDMLRVDLRLHPKYVVAEMKSRWGYEISYNKAWLSIRRACEMVFGDWEESFAHLPFLMQAIEHTNPNTYVKWNRTFADGKAMVNRVFWAFAPAVAAFQHCRPVLSVDGTHLFGRFNGKLLVAVGLDANNQLLPLCFALVESENNESWNWFMRHIRKGVTQRTELCVISDRHAGILYALSKPEWSPPNAYHRYCIRHLKSNFYSKVKDTHLKEKLDKVAWADQRFKCDSEYRELLHLIRDRPNVHRWLTEIPRSLWCLSYDEDGRRYGSMTTNASECFNNVLKGGRDLPISALVLFTFHQCVGYFCKRREMFSNRQDPVAPKVAQRLHPWSQKAHLHKVKVYNTSKGYCEVTTFRKHHVHKLNFENGICSCGKWTAFHYPCSHALAAASELRMPETSLISPWYKMDAFRATWAYDFYPLGDQREWPEYEGPLHVPNEEFRRAERGRLPSRRMRGEMDAAESSRQGSQRGSQRCSQSGSQSASHQSDKRKNTCRKCGGSGHNSRSCRLNHPQLQAISEWL